MTAQLYNSRLALRVAAAGALVALTAFFLLYLHSPSRLYIELTNDNDIDGQVYVDSGKGYVPEKVVSLSLMPDGKTHVYEVDIGDYLPKSIRFDPGNTAGNVRLGRVEFESAFYIRKVSCDELRLLHAVERSQGGHDECFIRAVAADPFIDFDVIANWSRNNIQIKWISILEGLAYSAITFALLFAACQARYRDDISQKQWLTNSRCIRFYLLLALGFASFVFLNLHVSSISEWKNFVSSDVSNGILLGKSRSIRSDEWLVQTPFYASQTKNGFDVQNPSLGAAGVALVSTVPVQGLYGYAQPRFWGFYLLGFEKGFSWLYAWRIFGLLLGGFVLFSIVTKGDFWLALMGSVWIALSPFMQWWFTTNLPDMVIGFAGGVAALYLLLSASTLLVSAAAAVILFFACITSATALYPAFLIPLFYLALFLIGGLIVRDKLYQTFLSHWTWKSLLLLVSIGGVLWIVAAWLDQAKAPITLMLNSVYPGKRVSLGGGLPLTWIFSGYFGTFLTSTAFPSIMGNVCNAGNFLLMFPLAWVVILRKYRHGLRISSLDIALSLYIVVILIWIIGGYPEWLAVSTRMSMSPPVRALLGLGLGSIFLIVSVSSSGIRESGKPVGTREVKKTILPLIALVLLFSGISFWLAHAYPDFVIWRRAIIVVPVLVLWSYAFLKGARKWVIALTGLLLLNGMAVNPLVHGVASLQNAQLASVLKEDKQAGGTKWLVFPNLVLPQYFKANGASVWNGVRFISDPEKMRVLDPEDKYRDVWYRYAHFIVEPLPIGKLPEFELKQTDVVLLKVDICSQAVHALGINRFAFTDKPNLAQMPCLNPIRHGPVSGLWLYKRIENKQIHKTITILKND